jgi:pimeloyl-ACP methyl ester carboxylesterase
MQLSLAETRARYGIGDLGGALTLRFSGHRQHREQTPGDIMRWSQTVAVMAVTTLMAQTVNAATVAVARRDFRVTTEDGVGIFVRELRPRTAKSGHEPLILLHGARVPGVGSFDLAVPAGSFASDLVERTGRIVYVMDVRGYGRSDRPAAMEQPPDANPPQTRAYQVVRDIAAVVAEAEQRAHSHTVALFGWATGGMWVSYYASLYPERVGHLITLNALYGGSDRHEMLGPGSSLSDPAHPDRLNPTTGAYSFNSADSLLRVWDQSIPQNDKSAWRDPEVVAAYQSAALASDPSSSTRQPPAFRAPLGAIEDSFYQASGRRLFDASSITARVLLVRSDRDFWSRPEDVQAFAHDATHAASVKILALPDATHFVHLDRPEHGRERLLNEVTAFVDDHRLPTHL